MGSATVEVSGAGAADWAAELHAALAANAQPGDSVSPVEVERSADVVIAIVGLVFSGVEAAKTIWDWWQDRRPQGTSVRILFSDGTQLELSDVSQSQLESTIKQIAARD